MVDDSRRQAVQSMCIGLLPVPVSSVWCPAPIWLTAVMGCLVGHEACDELPFVQYAGFSCMLPTPGIVPCDDHASVGVTIGYENAGPGRSSARRISANVLTRRKGRSHWRLEARRLRAWTSSTLPPGMNGLSYRCWKPYTVVFMNRRVRSALPLGLYATLQSPLIETRGWRTNTCTRVCLRPS